MNIKVNCYNKFARINQVTNAINTLNGIQNYFYFELYSKLNNEICVGDDVDWDDFCERTTQNKNEYNIYITEKPFTDNWFSHEESQYAIITTFDWEIHFAPPSLKAYLIYQMAQAALCFEGDLKEKMEMRMVHDPAEGCMFDFCGNKRDIKLGMIAGNICPQCRAILVRYGINEKAIDSIERMLSVVRAEAIGKPMIFDENAAFIVMRFSSNDENDNAYKYGVKPALEKLNIKCVRADNEISSGQLLDKIERYIERSRFIIVKIDSNNLNVYFELGLSMGKKKDVLLISENDLVLQLPSDLRNWECLTYEKGNYDELRDKILQYYINNFNYK